MRSHAGTVRGVCGLETKWTEHKAPPLRWSRQEYGVSHDQDLVGIVGVEKFFAGITGKTVCETAVILSDSSHHEEGPDLELSQSNH